jgi:hypothetical protein
MTPDEWKIHGNHMKYPTKKVYLSLINNPPRAPAPFKWIWRSACLPKHRFFFWLLIQDRLNNEDLTSRKNFHVTSKSCVLCDDNTDETLLHLFFSCDFNQTFWWKIDQAKQISSNNCFKEALIIGC